MLLWMQEEHNTIVKQQLQKIKSIYFLNGANGFIDQKIFCYRPEDTESEQHVIGCLSYTADFIEGKEQFMYQSYEEADAEVFLFTFSGTKLSANLRALTEGYSLLKRFFTDDGKYKKDLTNFHGSNPQHNLYENISE